jgi:hypothetical protein
MTLGAHYVSSVSSTEDDLFRLVCLRYGLQGIGNLSTMVGMETRNVERLDRLRETRVPGVLYPRLFGVAWSEIDPALQRMHCNCEPVHAAGVFRISHGTSLGAKLLHGAMLANLYPTIQDWGVRPTALKWTPANTMPMLRWCLTGMALGVLLSGMRDLYASLGLPCGNWPWTLPDSSRDGRP